VLFVPERFLSDYLTDFNEILDETFTHVRSTKVEKVFGGNQNQITRPPFCLFSIFIKHFLSNTNVFAYSFSTKKQRSVQAPKKKISFK